ncbi:hypothetical protein [Coraliomargarita akajimensis]|nr:hypothetical protein [Coraliomargarita akajimensis]
MNAPEDKGGYIRLATDSLQFFFVAPENDDEPQKSHCINAVALYQ